MNSRKWKHELPASIQSRIDYFINDLINANANGKHLVLGKGQQKRHSVTK